MACYCTVKKPYDDADQPDRDILEYVLDRLPELANFRFKTDVSETTPLMKACKTDDIGTVRALLDHGAEIGASGWSVEILMLTKSALGQSGVYAADQSRGGYGRLDGIFPLFIASEENNLLVVDELLKQGASVNQVNCIGQTALHVTCMGTEDNRLRLMIIEKGANVNLQDEHGKTPLHYTCQLGTKQSTEILLESGADPAIKDNRGLTALDIAANFRHENAEYLLEHCKWSDTEVIEAYETVAYGTTSILQYDYMIKATTMRTELCLPKKVLEPLECYGFIKEWETLEELTEYKNDHQRLNLYCLMARERIFQSRHIWGIVGVSHKVLPNLVRQFIESPEIVLALIRHFIELFKQNEDYSYFAQIVECGILKRIPATCVGGQLRKILTELLDWGFISCRELNERLQTETRKGASLALVSDLEKSLLAVGRIICVMLKDTHSGDSSPRELALERSLIQKLFNEFPVVSSSLLDYKAPLPHILLNKLKYACFPEPSLSSVQVLEILLELSFHINSTDSDGNTLLHLTILQGDLLCLDALELRIIEKITSLLLRKGIYLYARNLAGNTVIGDIQRYLQDNHENIPNAVSLILQYDQFPTLQRLTAQYLKSSTLHYADYLPQFLVQFVNLH